MRGGQWQAIHLMRSLRDLGHHPVLAARRGSLIFETARADGFETRSLTAATLLAGARGFDVVHAHDARSHTLAALTGCRPLVVSRRVAFPIGTGALSRWKYGRPDRFIAISECVAARLRDAGVPVDRIRVVHDGVPALAPGPPSGRIVAPVTGDPAKGDDLLRATKLPIHWSADLTRDLPGACMLIYLTREEGLGSAVLLAMSAGVPVIASAVGGLRELIRDGDNGLLVANEPGAIESAAHRLMAGPELARRLAVRARQCYESAFTVRHMAEATLAVYREVA